MWKPTPPPAKLYKKENLEEIKQFSQFIYTLGEAPILKTKAKIVSPKEVTSPEFKQKVTYLKKCFTDFRKITSGKGRGIASVQAGIKESFFLLFNEKDESLITFINPTVTKTAASFYEYPEACMSANSLIATVVRPGWVEFEYLNEQGEQGKWTLKDTNYEGKMANRIVQHEIDHLNGIINIEKVLPSSLVFEMGTDYYGKARFHKVKEK